MGVKVEFDFSGLIKDKSDLEEIEFWGHDAGEFVELTATDLDLLEKQLESHLVVESGDGDLATS